MTNIFIQSIVENNISDSVWKEMQASLCVSNFKFLYKTSYTKSRKADDLYLFVYIANEITLNPTICTKFLCSFPVEIYEYKGL